VIETPEENDVMNVMKRFPCAFRKRRSWIVRIRCAVAGTTCGRRAGVPLMKGNTWGPAVQCMPAAGYYVVNNDRVVRLKSGRLVIPAALHRSLADRNEASAVDWRGIAEFFLTTTGALGGRPGGYCTLPIVHTKSGLQEPGLIELGNGCFGRGRGPIRAANTNFFLRWWRDVERACALPLHLAQLAAFHEAYARVGASAGDLESGSRLRRPGRSSRLGRPARPWWRRRVRRRTVAGVARS